MSPALHRLPTVLALVAGVLLLLSGPISQPPDYNNFADHSRILGIAHGADVLSNLGFALVAIWGWIRLWPRRYGPALAHGWCGYRLFLAGLLLTAVGSTWYHLAPDNQRLVWDRLPIALTMAGLLAAVRAETVADTRVVRYATVLTLIATLSVAWWHYTDQPQHPGDLGPSLAFQVLALLLIPLWQAIYEAPRADRLGFGVAIALYVLAKLAELRDHELLAILGFVNGHTLKHLLATAAAGVLVATLVQRSATSRSPRSRSRPGS